MHAGIKPAVMHDGVFRVAGGEQYFQRRAAALKLAGVEIALNGDCLALRAASEPPAAVLSLLSIHKREVLALLRRRSSDIGEAVGDKQQRLSSDLFADGYRNLSSKCPDHIPEDRWHRAIEDGRTFLNQWGEEARALGWTADDLFGLHVPPTKPHPSYCRLSRYDCTGLIWLLQGMPVVMLTAGTASIRNPTGSITAYRRNNKPGLGPLGDSLDDFK